MTAESTAQITQLAQAIAQALTQTLIPALAQTRQGPEDARRDDRGGSIFDRKMLQNMKPFSGEGYYDWQRKVKNYLRCMNPLTVTLMTNAENQAEPIILADVEQSFGDEGVKMNAELGAFLEFHTEGPAAQTISTAQGSGVEAWRLLSRRYDPRTSESKRALMKRVVNVTPAKTLSELERTLQKWEITVRRYEGATGTSLNDDIKVNCLIALCPPRLEDHLNLTIRDDEGYDTVRKEIVRQIEKGRDTNEPSPMDVGSWEQVSPDQWSESWPTEAAWEHDEPHGEPEDLDAVTRMTQCYRCQGYGHISSRCPTPPEMSKGNDKGGRTGKGKGKGKNGKNGKDTRGPLNPRNNSSGKGVTPINGWCHSCGEYGHMSRECRMTGRDANQISTDTNKNEGTKAEAATEISGFELCAVERRMPGRWARPRTRTELSNRFSPLAEEEPESVAEEPPNNMSNGNLDVGVVAKMCERMAGKITVDSGAAESVMPADFMADLPMQASPPDKQGARYIAANGSVMTNVGQKKLLFQTKDGTINAITFQATGVRKPLAAVSRIVENGNRVVFSPEGSFIEHIGTGQRIDLEREAGTYVMNVKFLTQGFTGQR